MSLAVCLLSDEEVVGRSLWHQLLSTRNGGSIIVYNPVRHIMNEGSSTGRVSFVLDPHFPTKCFLSINHKFPAINVSLLLTSFFSSDYI